VRRAKKASSSVSAKARSSSRDLAHQLDERGSLEQAHHRNRQAELALEPARQLRHHQGIETELGEAQSATNANDRNGFARGGAALAHPSAVASQAARRHYFGRQAPPQVSTT
jgi:hypothetical protein